jgi:hypothetical protein
LTCVAVAALAGCDVTTEALLGESTVSEEVREACTGVMSESDMFTAVTIARIDRLNGYTRTEEFQAAAQGCTTDSALGGADYDQCMVCKTAILDVVYGP